jgi:hypothetical protein
MEGAKPAKLRKVKITRGLAFVDYFAVWIRGEQVFGMISSEGSIA